MAGDDIPNEKQYAAKDGVYLSTQVLTHGGVTIAFALGKAKDETLFFDYSILNATNDAVHTEQTKADAKANPTRPKDDPEQLDSQHWFEDTKSLRFPSEVRVVGEEAVPTYQLPLVDVAGLKIGPENESKLDRWTSTSLCLMDPRITNFQVTSDGKYVYIFRQSRLGSDSFLLGKLEKLLKDASRPKPPVDSNLLCDRFMLVGSTLQRTLEVRFRRSGQKRLPLNNKDTLAVKDINEEAFYEPTFSLRFVGDLRAGRFRVLQTPTMTNDISRWMIFACSNPDSQIDCFTADVASDGLFDIHGRTYYTCNNDHKEIFATAPGTCTALRDTGEHLGEVCGKVKKVSVPKAPSTNCALTLAKDPTGKDTVLRLVLARNAKIDLSSTPFLEGYTLEAWVRPVAPAVIQTPEAAAAAAAVHDVSATAFSRCPLFSLTPATRSPSGAVMLDDFGNEPDYPILYITEQLTVAIQIAGATADLATSTKLSAGSWNHVALTFVAGTDPTVELFVNGEAAEAGPQKLPANTKPGIIDQLIRQPPPEQTQFHGSLDEIRVWSYPLQPATIKSRMSTRLTGLEPYLEACWHLDEASGQIAYDVTPKKYDLLIHTSSSLGMKTQEAASAPKIDSPMLFAWNERAAKMAGSTGLVKRPIRLPEDVTVAGGLGASVYYEQVSLSAAPAISGSASTAAAGEQESKEKKANAGVKPMKRGARLLLCFVAKVKSKEKSTLATIDFGLLSDGTLCDLPPVVPLRPLKAISRKVDTAAHEKSTEKYAPTSLLSIDPTGIEIFGGYLDFPAAECSADAPFVWDSATGSVTIYYKNMAQLDPGSFSALTYDVSRSMTADSLVALAKLPGVLAASKLRQAKKVTIATLASGFDTQDAVNVRITATMADGEMSEDWQNVPAELDKFCDLLSGHSTSTRITFGNLAADVFPYTRDEVTTLRLEQRLREKLVAGTGISVGGWRYVVQKDAAADATTILASGSAKKSSVPKSEKRVKGTVVESLGYDFKGLVKTKGKPAPDYSLGSALISITSFVPQSDTALNQSKMKIAIDCEARIAGNGDCPCFAAPNPSTALQLKDDTIYSMLGKGLRAPADPGLAFEGWIKVTKLTESVVVAYTSQRSPLSEGMSNDYQTFVLSVTSPSSGRFQLACNANGRLLSVKDDDVFQANKWFHFACSLHNTLALHFNGSNYVELGAAAEFNLQDFSIAFTLQLSAGGRDQIVLTKPPDASGGDSPLNVEVTSSNRLRLTFWAKDEAGAKETTEKHTYTSDGTLEVGKAYKILISREYTQIKRTNESPRWAQCVTMKAWDTADRSISLLTPPSVQQLVDGEKDKKTLLTTDGAAQPSGVASSNTAALCLGGAPGSTSGLSGTLGFVRLYSAPMHLLPTSSRRFCTADNSESGLVASWSCQSGETKALIDDTGRNHGKLRKEPKPQWELSPFAPDHRVGVYINGKLKTISTTAETRALERPAGPHQLTLGNVIKENGTQDSRFMLYGNSFEGELDEVRIWGVPRTRNNICDTMNARLDEVPPELSVYLPFDVEDNGRPANSTAGMGILADHSINSWHLTPLYGSNLSHTISQAPVGRDASCVQHTYGDMAADRTIKGASLNSAPSVTEYGTMQLGASGTFEGSFKRAYSFIDSTKNIWRLDTGFRIGALLTEWVSQVQTSPTLIGYIEGAPPVPAENYTHKDEKPTSSIKFINTKYVQYSYGLRTEDQTDVNITGSRGGGAEWKVSAGIGVESEVSSGKVKGFLKTVVDISDGQFNNNVNTIKAHTNMDLKMDLTGTWAEETDAEKAQSGQGDVPAKQPVNRYNPANTGLALVESEVADVFALRLKIRGSVPPLIAYQVRPNPDIPKDRNLVAFPINNKYTKQGCLNGRRGTAADEDYISQTDAPKDASYYKPVEAYALKDLVRRAEEQLAGEFDRYRITGDKEVKDLPSRARRNICNSYVWTAEGGTFQETHQTMDFVQQEVGGNDNFKAGAGGGFDMELVAACVLCTAQFDALYSAHTNIMQTKDKQTETGFELIAELPPPLNIRTLNSKGVFEKQKGAVDAYRWMTFWLEPSVEGTDAFFKQVVDDQWVQQSPEPSAVLLRQLRDSLNSQQGDARTKAWRLFHRVTYVSRVLENIQAADKAAAEVEKKNSALLADVSCNWLILERLEPRVRAAKSRREVKDIAVPEITLQYPSLAADPRLLSQMVELLGDYIGLDI